MTRGEVRFRGQPVLLLGAVLCAWVGARVALWDNPLATVRPTVAPATGVPAASRPSAPVPDAAPLAGAVPVAAWPALPASSPAVTLPPPLQVTLPAVEPAPLRIEPPSTEPVPPPPPAPVPARVAVGHTLLLAAGLSQMELPAALLAYLGPAARPATATATANVAAPGPPRARASRWSADGWLLLRQDSASPLLSGRPSYGRSQAGAVVRYRLAPGSARAPQAYLRGSAALAGQREKEVAAGLSVRPLPRLPVRIAAEARIGETDAGTQVRPAVFAVTELPVVALPMGLQGEAYAQAGYVGGRFSTAFADGQARIDRKVTRVEGVDLRAGAGAWGGAQQGAARLDLGPTAALSFRLGEGQGRISADYRVRVAGRAEPSSGPSLTLSAGF